MPGIKLDEFMVASDWSKYNLIDVQLKEDGQRLFNFTKRFTISGAGITTSGEPYVLRQNW